MWDRIRSWSVRRRAWAAVLVVLAVVVLYVGYSGVRLWLAWRAIERTDFDLTQARTALEWPERPGLVRDGFDTVLIIGSDERVEDEGDGHEGRFADAVLFFLDAGDGHPVFVSLPRDLFVDNPCTGDPTRLSRMLGGCDDPDLTGEQLLALAVEDLTGVAVDHLAVVGFGSLTATIDAIGGITLCSDHALRDWWLPIIPAGCSIADGTSVLRYVRSRTTQEFVDGEWRYRAGVSDLTRAERQQEVLMAILGRAKQIRTPGRLADLVTAAGAALTLDETLGLRDAVGLAWRLRSTPLDDIARITLPTELRLTDDGTLRREPTASLLDLIAATREGR
jgi:LCP family protein required for cell wall assembly